MATLGALLALAACGGGADSPAGARSGPESLPAQAVPAANQPPMPVILSPTSGSTFKSGDTLTIQVQGSDAEDGLLAAAATTWWVDLHHDLHTHPLQLETEGNGGSITMPPRIETSANIWLRVHVRVTDSAGASSETTRDILPVKSTFTLASAPVGLELTLDGSAVLAPVSVLGVVGTERDIGAADQSLGSRRYRFMGWSDAGSAVHAMTTPLVATTFTATFADNGPTSNLLPGVTVTASASAPVPGIPVTLSAVASDSDGSVTKVDFFDGATLIGSDAAPPYTVAWTPATGGDHVLTARATDNLGAVATSAPLELTVGVPLYGGLTGRYYANTSLAGAAVLTRTEALDMVWTGSPVAGLPANGWSASWTGYVRLPTSGDYSFELIADDGVRVWVGGEAIAAHWMAGGNKTYRSATLAGTAGALLPMRVEHYDGTGDSTVRLRWKSPADPLYWVTVPAAHLLPAAPATNAGPTVSLTAPATGVAGFAVALGAAADDSDGSVVKVDFFNGAMLIGSDTSPPYGVAWMPSAAGAYAITARATDDTGNTATSSAATVLVSVTQPGGLVGSYFANTSLSGTPVLTRTDVLNVAWAGSPGAGVPADGWSARWTGYVRLPASGSYTFELIADDGARAWINGQVMASHWVAGGNKTYRSAVLTGTAGDLLPVLIEHFDGTGHSSVLLRWQSPAAPSYWVPVPAAELLQSTVTNSAPSVALTAASTAVAGTTVTLTASASDSGGRVTKVEFFDAATLIGSDTTAPYSVAWTPVAVGAHSLTARATDDAGATTTSPAVLVSVAGSGSDIVPPAVALTAPADLADNLGGMLTLSASASDNVGVVAVEFQLDGAILGTADTSAPFQATVDTTLHMPGQHILRARARDAAGNLSTWATATVRFAGSRLVPAGFTLTQPWRGGFNAGTAFTQAPDGRFFVANQDGRLLVIKGGVLLGTPMLTLSVDNTGERGLIGVTLHPNFATNGWIYVYYTRINGNSRNNRISRFVATGDSTTGIETVIADLPALSSSYFHNGGAMHFGADGKLFVAVGDNTSGAKAQILADPFGKMLRFNDDGTIPGDNPFCTSNGNIACAVWAYGLRNPFTFAVQAGTGRLYINDVGEGTWEEINLGAAGANYGWPASEGPSKLTAAMTGPLFTYRHTATSPPGTGSGGFFVGNAVVGGAFYPANGPFPARYAGKYFFADYVNRYIAVLDPADAGMAHAFAQLSQAPVGLLVGNDGAIYVLGRATIVRISVP